MTVLAVGNTEIIYTIRRSENARKKRIVVTPDSVEVVAPLGVSEKSVEQFVRSKAKWIFNTSEHMTDRIVAKLVPERYVSGAKIPYRGRLMKLRVKEDGDGGLSIAYRGGFYVGVPKGLDAREREELIKRGLRGWFKEHLQEDVGGFVRRISKKLELSPRGVRIQELSKLWASCGRNGIISLDWRLIFVPKTVLEYVVAHEMCHLQHRTHTPEFWRLLASVMPDFEERKGWLDSFYAESVEM